MGFAALAHGYDVSPFQGYSHSSPPAHSFGGHVSSAFLPHEKDRNLEIGSFSPSLPLSLSLSLVFGNWKLEILLFAHSPPFSRLWKLDIRNWKLGIWFISLSPLLSLSPFLSVSSSLSLSVSSSLSPSATLSLSLSRPVSTLRMFRYCVHPESFIKMTADLFGSIYRAMLTTSTAKTDHQAVKPSG